MTKWICKELLFSDFVFGNHMKNVQFEEHQNPNYRLEDVCRKDTDTTLVSKLKVWMIYCIAEMSTHVMNVFRTMTRILLKWLWSFSLFRIQWMKWIPRRGINKSLLVSRTSINIIVSQLDLANVIFSFVSYFYTNKSQISDFSAQIFTVSPVTDDK